jgi:hypothetical protein
MPRGEDGRVREHDVEVRNERPQLELLEVALLCCVVAVVCFGVLLECFGVFVFFWFVGSGWVFCLFGWVGGSVDACRRTHTHTHV